MVENHCGKIFPQSVRGKTPPRMCIILRTCRRFAALECPRCAVLGRWKLSIEQWVFNALALAVLFQQIIESLDSQGV